LRDTVSYTDATAGVMVDLGLGTVTGGSRNDTVSGIESVAGTRFNDIIKGDGDHNSLSGGVDDDQLRGRNGNDFLYGGAGYDTSIGADGLDTCEGGEVTDGCEFFA